MSVQSFYGQWSGLYDRLATLPGVDRWRAATADALGLSGGETVVDLGCGTGATLPHLRSRVGPDGRVVGVDVTRPLLDRARVRVERAGWTNVDLVHGDATRPPVERADAVCCTFVMGMFDDPERVVTDICSWCDGRVALLDATTSSHPVGRLLNPVFGAFVGAGAPADTLGESARQALSDGALQSLDTKVGDSRTALTARTVDRRFETVGLGFVGLLSGRVE